VIQLPKFILLLILAIAVQIPALGQTGPLRLGGSYTVDSFGSGPSNFLSIADAVAALNRGTVTNAVTFTIASGQYNGEISLTSIPGMSATNTVTFRAAHPDSFKIISGGSAPTIHLNGADHVHFQNISIENTNWGSVAVKLDDKADHNSFIGCHIKAVAGYPGYAVFIGSSLWNRDASSGSYNSFKDNRFVGGYINVAVGGGDGRIAADRTIGNAFVNNSFAGSVSTNADIRYNDSLEFIGNTLDVGTYGQKNFNGTQLENFNISGNRLNGGGLDVRFNNQIGYNGAEPSKIINNVIIVERFTFGLYMHASHHVDVQHNSILSLKRSSGREGAYFYYSTFIDFRNNIIDQRAPARAIQANSTTFTHFDYNNFHIGSLALGLAMIDGVDLKDLSKLKAGSKSYNHNSSSLDPDWDHAARDLRPGSNFPDLYGPNPGVAIDHDSTARCEVGATLGAYESSKSNGRIRADFTVPDTIWEGSFGVFQNKLSASNQYKAQWFVNGKFVSDSIHLMYRALKPGVDTVMLVMENCEGADTTTKNVLVSKVLRAPKVNFSAKALTVYKGVPVRFFDLSKNGPAEWWWDISPKFGHDFFSGFIKSFRMDSTVQNPWVVFDVAGNYTVKLKASNVRGADSVTKNLYIRVLDRANICGNIVESNAIQGTLFDDGGADDVYSKGLNGHFRCTYTIKNCTGAMDFTVKSFDLALTDNLKIYDGQDEDGRPLWDDVNYPDGMTGDMTHGSIVKSFTAQSGVVYVVFETSDFSTVGEGFAIDWETGNPLQAPVASFNSLDTVCRDLPFVLENTSTGSWVYAEWDVDEDGFYDRSGNTLVLTPDSAQTLDIKMKAYSACGRSDTIVKSIIIEDANRVPKPTFTVSDTFVVSGNPVDFIGSATYCTGGYRWEISPANYVLTNGASLTDPNMSLSFTAAGRYTVKFVVSNPFGADSVVKTNYIRVIKYCNPEVTYLKADLGIGSVSFEQINATSPVGERSYTLYADEIAYVKTNSRYAITLSRSTAGENISRKVWIDWNVDGDFDDANELVASEASGGLSFTDSIYVPKNALLGTTRMRISTNLAGLNNDACGPHMFGEFEDYRIHVSLLNTAPTIALSGKTTDTVEVFGTWVDPGFTANDPQEGDISGSVLVTNIVNTNELGTYTVTYEVADSGGLKANATRTVVVVDRTVPELVLIGLDTIVMDVDSVFVDPGTTPSDNYDKVFNVITTGMVDNSTLGYYTLTYCLTDVSGNGPVCVNRVVEVIDRIAPVLASDSKLYVPRWQPFDASLDVSFRDNYYSEDKLDVTVVSNNVNVLAVGEYVVEYEVTDPSNNTYVLSYPVEVVETGQTLNAEEPGIAKVNVFPNPSSGKFYIDLPMDEPFEGALLIANAQGKVVYVSNDLSTNHRNAIDISHLPAGVYCVKLNGSDFDMQTRLVLMK